MNIWDIYLFNLSRLNKDQSGRSLPVDEFNLTADMVNYSFFKVKVGLPEQYQPGMPFPAQAWQVSQQITEAMEPFMKWLGGPDYPIMLLDKYGVSSIPEDFFSMPTAYFNLIHQNSCQDIEESFRPIEFLTDAVYADRQSSPIKFPDKEYPIAKFIGNRKIQFLPKTLKAVHFMYLRKPVTPYLAVTEDSNNNYVYDPANSIQFEWPELYLPDIANLIFEVMAENLKSQVDIEMAVRRKMSGQ